MPQGARPPAERRETIRQRLLSLLDGPPVSARDISGALSVPERAVGDHLEHIRKSLGRGDKTLVIDPPYCKRCEFIFEDRVRLSKPGRCPSCKGTSVAPPLFSVRGPGDR